MGSSSFQAGALDCSCSGRSGACHLLFYHVVSPNAGVRHVMVLFPLLSVIAVTGCAYLWQAQGRRHVWGRFTLAVLLLWQCLSRLNAHPDYIAYFNGLAGRNPDGY